MRRRNEICEKGVELNMKRNELDENIKEKLLLEGLTSSGKTLLAMKISKLYAMNGKKVLYVDVEHGSDREKKRLFGDLTDEELSRIDIIHATDIDSLLKYMLGWVEDKSIGSQEVKIHHGIDYDLKVVDDLVSEIDLFKAKLTQRFIRQGRYEIGGKLFTIENKDTFILPFNFYARIYEQITEALVTMLTHDYDLVCTMHPLKDTESQQSLQEKIYMKFDSVVRLQKILLPNGFPRWSAVIVKNRGREAPDKSNTLDNIDPLLVYFIKKFNMDVDSILERLK